ncbi:hypothetical protein CAPTEDRAFT_195982 [Capitella teleta]|uniref:Aspartic peptidase DDI1-type domain-containing protein n=1 Tax=Capitella teleta TaxID=283909 RepID=R7TI75_CAPTE|nr:hypothetical protein CAPTEDRAFT_195982 [Capitella teleta]|eukprot:ELT91241.1 hypothetical protein CAPTEDRAFT_195982 [Capitella teleta]
MFSASGLLHGRSARKQVRDPWRHHRPRQEVLLAMLNFPANFWGEKLESEPPEVCCDPEQPNLESTTTEISDTASSHSNTEVKLEPAAEDSTTTGFKEIEDHFAPKQGTGMKGSDAQLLNTIEKCQNRPPRSTLEPLAMNVNRERCKEKLAAYSALNQKLAIVEWAVNLVEGAVTDQQAVFGSTVPVSKLRQVLQFENPTQTQPDDYQVQAVRASSVEGLEAATEKRFRQCEGALVEVKAGLSSLGEQMKESSATTATNLGILVMNVLTRSDCPDHGQTPQSALNVSIVMNQTDTSRSGGVAYDSTNPTGWPPTSAEHATREVELHSTTGATILVDVEVGSGMIQAVVDTTCQITVFSVTAWRNLCPSPSLEEEIILTGAAVLGRMKANMAQDIQLRLGGQSYFWDCCVAPISDDLILGLDFLHAHGAVVDLPQACLSL